MLELGLHPSHQDQDPSPDPESPPRGLETEDPERRSREGPTGSHLQYLESPLRGPQTTAGLGMAPVTPSLGHLHHTGKGHLIKLGNPTPVITDQVQVTEDHLVLGKVHHPEDMVLQEEEEDLQDTDHQEAMVRQGTILHPDIFHILDTSLLQVTVHHVTTLPQGMVHQGTGPLDLVMVVVGTGPQVQGVTEVVQEVPEIGHQGSEEEDEVELFGDTPAGHLKDQGPDLLLEWLTHRQGILPQGMTWSPHTWEIQVHHHQHSITKGHQKMFPESPETKDLPPEYCPLVPST